MSQNLSSAADVIDALMVERRLLLSADKPCKQFVPRSVGPNLDHEINFEKKKTIENTDDIDIKNYPACEVLQ